MTPPPAGPTAPVSDAAILNGGGKGSMLRIPLIFVIGLVLSALGFLFIENMTRKAEAQDLLYKYEMIDRRLSDATRELERTNDRLDKIMPVLLEIQGRARRGTHGRDG